MTVSQLRSSRGTFTVSNMGMYGVESFTALVNPPSVAAGRPYRSFRGLIDHLAILTRNQVRFAGTAITVPVLAEPTRAQREAFTLLGTPIPLTLT
jgi:hypothetical protein